MSRTIEVERDAAVIQVAQLKKDIAKIKSDTEAMTRKFSTLQKDSEQLVQERKKITQLTLDVTKAKEKEEAATQNLKEAKKKLSKAERELVDVTAEREDYKRKAEFLEEKLANLQKEHKELQTKYDNNAEDLAMLSGQNTKYRDTMVKNEGVLSTQTKELREALKSKEVSKSTADRLKDENAVLVKQNQNLVQELKDLAEEDGLRQQQIVNRNEQAIIDGAELNAAQLKQRLRETQDQQVQMRREFDAAQAAIQQEIQVTRDASAQIKEDYEILEERFKKN